MYPFWARWGWCIETVRLHAPGKIPRDSPAALPRAKKKLMMSAGRLVFGTVSFSTNHLLSLIVLSVCSNYSSLSGWVLLELIRLTQKLSAMRKLLYLWLLFLQIYYSEATIIALGGPPTGVFGSKFFHPTFRYISHRVVSDRRCSATSLQSQYATPS